MICLKMDDEAFDYIEKLEGKNAGLSGEISFLKGLLFFRSFDYSNAFRWAKIALNKNY